MLRLLGEQSETLVWAPWPQELANVVAFLTIRCTFIASPIWRIKASNDEIKIHSLSQSDQNLYKVAIEVSKLLFYLKVSKSQKQIMVSSILPKMNEKNSTC